MEKVGEILRLYISERGHGCCECRQAQSDFNACKGSMLRLVVKLAVMVVEVYAQIQRIFAYPRVASSDMTSPSDIPASTTSRK